MIGLDYEFYETPKTFTKYLFREIRIEGTLFEPCVGNGAILKSTPQVDWNGRVPLHAWVTNDLDPRWPADYHLNAAGPDLWNRQGLHALGGIDWTISNPPFTPAIEIITRALEASQVGVAMHLRASIHEVLKTGVRRTWMAQHPPRGLLWLPRFAYQRSKTKGIWQTDSVCACWCVWLKDTSAPQFIRYAPEWVLNELENETLSYRERMDALMGYSGSEVERQQQRKAAA